MNYCKFIDIGGSVNYCLPGHCPVDDFEVYSEAHPNIKFKGDKIDPNCKNTFKMIDYVVKQKEEIKYRLNHDKIIISSNFDWEPLWKELKQKMKEKEIKQKLQLIEHDFCVWLRDLILNRNEMTRAEIEHAIIEHEKFSEMFLMKHYNYKTVLDSFFKVKPNVKPKPYWGTFFLPVELYRFCMKLDEWVKKWFDPNIKDKGSRPEGCFVSGRAKCGKTSLFMCFGNPCYWCNTWNYDAYESKPPFNMFDDFDGSYDLKGNQIHNSFHLMKPWFGGQDIVTISGKYKAPKTVVNGRPCVFVSNYPFEERFENEADRQYIRDCCTVIDLGDNDLVTPKDRRTLGGFTNWVEYDTRNTWYYKNIVSKNLEHAEERRLMDEIIEISSTPIQPADLTQEDDGSIVLIKEDPESEIILNENNEEVDDVILTESSQSSAESVPAANSNSIGRPKRSRGWLASLFETTSKRSKN